MWQKPFPDSNGTRLAVQQAGRNAVKPLENAADLRYIAAESVRCPQGSLSDFQVCTEDAQSLGRVEGVLISSASRRVAYFVTTSPGLLPHHHYLVPLDAGAVLQDEPKTLRLSARKDELDLQTFTPRSFPPLSDEDVAFAKTA
jgi:hypothetical protein